MSDVASAIEAYTTFLKSTEEQHKKTIADAHAQLEALIAATAAPAPAPEVEPVAPQSVWITDNDGDKLLLLNEAAVEQITLLFTGFQEVIELLKKEHS